MITARRSQTRVPDIHRTFSLVVSGVLSPYFQMIDTRKVGTTRNIRFIPELMAVNRAVVRDIEDGGAGQFIAVCAFIDSSGSTVEVNIAFFSTASIVDNASYIAAAESAINVYAGSKGYTLTLGIIWSSVSEARVLALIAAAAGASSYQTIVSQTGTAAPAVTSGFTPISTYPTGTTFAWARTGTGVYTLTASAAVFNVAAGKTGVSISAPTSPLNNVSAVVTSTTVITFTSSSLNLLALGVSNADALMSKTMIYVQTYS